MDLIDDLAGEGTPIDLIFVGSSVVRSNIDPLAFDTEFGRRCGRNDLVSFNAGHSGAGVAAATVLLSNVYLEADPKLVIQFVRPEELRNVDNDLLLFQDSEIDRLWADNRLEGSLRGFLFDASALFRLRGGISRWALDETTSSFAIDMRGHSRSTTILAQAREEKPLDQIPGAEPETAERVRPHIPQAADQYIPTAPFPAPASSVPRGPAQRRGAGRAAG